MASCGMLRSNPGKLHVFAIRLRAYPETVARYKNVATPKRREFWGRPRRDARLAAEHWMSLPPERGKRRRRM